MNKFESIELIFENFDSIKICKEFIGFLHISDINKSNLFNKYNNTEEFFKAEEIFLRIKPEANNCSSYIEYCGEIIKPFERIIKFDDISTIKINYQDGDKMYIDVKWVEIEEDKNECQSTKIDEEGNLLIIISEKENVESYLERESKWWKN